MRIILVASLFTYYGLAAAGESPLCLSYGDGKSLCSSVSFPNGDHLSEFLNKVFSVAVNREGQVKMTPEAFNEPSPAAEGVFSPNTKLDNNTSAVYEGLNGPESIARDGDFFYGAATDAIYKIHVKTGEKTKIFDGNAKCGSETPCSRPFGIRVKNGKLYCADGLAGLIEVDTTSGESKVLLPIGSLINGEKLTFPDDLDVDWENGIIYMSDASTKWPLPQWAMAVFESDNSGRIIRYNIATKEVDVFANNIHFANGIQISHDKKSLLVCEFSAKKVLKFPLEGPVPATGTAFTQTLPGLLDNIRSSKSGGYWIGSPIYPDGKSSVFDEIRKDKDLIEKLGNWMLTAGETVEAFGKISNDSNLLRLGRELKSGEAFSKHTIWTASAIYEVDSEGKIIQVLQTMDQACFTEILEEDDALFLGSFKKNFVLRVPKSNYRA